MTRRVTLHALLVLVAQAIPSVTTAGGPCGDPPFDVCDEGEFCQRLVCGFPYPVGLCTEIPDVCSHEVDPVCGCDLQTYLNFCEALREQMSVATHSTCHLNCGGPSQDPCGPGSFCHTPPGECFADGVCLEVVEDCPSTCSPACGCNGQTYTNRCFAHNEGTGIDYDGECGYPDHLLVKGVAFIDSEWMVWNERVEAVGYNVYREIVAGDPPDDAGSCFETNVSLPTFELTEDPEPGETWLIQVTATFPGGEGPLGTGADCTQRQSNAPCGQ